MAKSVSINELRQRCSRFVVDWRDAPGEERQQGQSFVRDLLTAFGINKSKAVLYEERAKRESTGHGGYIDAFLPGLCLIEMKSKGKDLLVAETQAKDYITGLPDIQVPRWIIASDFASFRVVDLQADPEPLVETFTLEELPQHVEALAFLAGYQTRRFGNQKQEQASIRAAQIMASLYESLEGTGYTDHEASVFLVRTLFCLYADDAGMWERDLFYEFLETRTNPDGTDLGPQLSLLYQEMNRPSERRQTNLDELINRFPYVNGGIFAETVSIPSFNHAMRNKLIQACAFNWSVISPAVFGSLFQAVKSPEARRELGEHYTTETNILKTINPLFMDELRSRFAQDATNLPRLRKLRTDISRLRIFDPACGCGNFLVIAYRELRALDLQILQRIQDLDPAENPSIFFVKENLAVTLDHFVGIEIAEWPARIATTALHLVDHQANQQMELTLGAAPDPLPLDKIDTIHVTNALRTAWEDIMPPSDDVRIISNPPFVGHQTKTPAQVADLKAVWGALYDGYLDYVTGWYKKASDYFRTSQGGRFAFVSTNSVSQGQPVAALFRPLFAVGWRIRFAHQTFPWTSEAPRAAAVHCVIIGFDKNTTPPAELYTYPADSCEPVRTPARNINPYLIDAPLIFVDKRTHPLSAIPEAYFGTMPIDGGHLIVEPSEYPEVAADPIATKYLRKFVGARELIHNEQRWCLWMESLDPTDVAASPILRDRIEACRHYRETAPKKGGDAYKYRRTPHLFRPNAHRPTTPYVCMPSVFSEKRRYFTAAYLTPDVIASNLVFTAEDPSGFLFGIISSSMFLVWQRTVGGRLKSDLRFSATVVWNNLPLPHVDESLRQRIIQAGQGVLDVRSTHLERSLADWYNPLAMDPALLHAHDRLDAVVDRAFGATHTCTSNEERRSILFARYQELSQAGQLPPAKKATRRRSP